MRGLCLLALILPGTGLGAAEVSPGGKIFAGYKRVLSGPNGVGDNAFGVYRAYLGLGARFSPPDASCYAGARIIYDVAPGDSATPMMAFLKYAYGELGSSSLLPGEARVRLGQIPTPWIGNEEHLWRFRFVQKVMADRVGLLSSADRGLGVAYDLPRGLGGFYATYTNGEGYKSTEINAFKDISARLSLYPLPPLGLHLYYQKGTPQGGQVRNRALGALSLSWQNAWGLLVQTLMAEDGLSGSPTRASGASGWAWLDLGKLMGQERSWGVFLRGDFFDPDRDADEDAETYALVGAYYTFAEGWTFSGNYGATLAQDSALSVHEGILKMDILAKF